MMLINAASASACLETCSFLMAPHYWAPKYEVTDSGTENNFLILKEAAHSRAPPGGPQDEAAVSRKIDRSAEVLEATDSGAQKRFSRCSIGSE